MQALYQGDVSKPKYIFLFVRSSMAGAVVENVRTVFEHLNDATIYIPNLRQTVIV